MHRGWDRVSETEETATLVVAYSMAPCREFKDKQGVTEWREGRKRGGTERSGR